MKRLFIIVGILLIPLTIIVLLLTGVIGNKPKTVTRASLTMWVTDDDVNTFNAAIKTYRETHSYVTIKVTKIRREDYATRLLEGWAQGKGPDIFFVPSSWIGAMQPYAIPMPADLSVSVVATTKGIFGPQTTITKPLVKAPTVSQMKEWYVDAVSDDVLSGTQIWGLPLSMDTLVTYVNKDLLNNAGVFEPAKTWTELTTQIEQKGLSVQNDSAAIVQSGAALGTSTNIPHANELVTLLMMQNGSKMINTSAKKALFNDAAGLVAIKFYTSFSSPKKATYSWNADQQNALDAFKKGKIAYFFGTYADRASIAASGLNWTTSPMLHLDTQGDRDGVTGNIRFINAAIYNVGMVSKAAQTAKRSVAAWSFLRFLANSENVPAYLKTTDRLSALKSVLAKQKTEATKSVYAEQLLTARNWYRGGDGVKAETYITNMINAITVDGETPESALNLAAKQVETTL